jgi:hypothetical protein
MRKGAKRPLPGHALTRTQINQRMRAARPIPHWLYSAKHYAKKRGIEWNLTEADIVVPEFCPVFPWIKLERSIGRVRDNSPSLDRLNNDGPYSKENVRVISYLANRIKNNANLEQLISVVLYLVRELRQ